MAAANANPDNWEWHAESKKTWTTATESWQEFNAKWYGSCAPLHDSESPSLFLGHRLSAIGNFPSEILVRECYSTIFDRVWAKAMTPGCKIGSLITGQPGTGKTLSLFYLLVRLLQLQQVVLFTFDGRSLHLFYHGKVYASNIVLLDTTLEEYQLPQPKSQTSEVFIWSLFHIKQMQEPSMALFTYPCLPVQAAPPGSTRFRVWYKELRPMLVGLPLWSRDELAKSLPYQRRYNSFLDALRKDPSQYERDPLQPFPGARELLDEFQKDAGPVQPEAFLDYLLGIAIDRFGHSARDVFYAVFDYSNTMGIYQASFRLTFADLDDAIYTLLTLQNSSSVCHEMLALSPVYSGPYRNDRWTVNFKSEWIARGIIQHISIAERNSICRKIVQRFPQASAVAGYFKPDTHRLLSQSASQT